MKLQRNSKLNGFERKTKENVCFSLETIEFTVALRLHLYFASAGLLAGPGWARAGGRAVLGRGSPPAAIQRGLLPACLRPPACLLLACLACLLALPPACPPACLHCCLPCLPACLPACHLLACLLACTAACLLACTAACLFACLRCCLLACPPIRHPRCSPTNSAKAQTPQQHR